VNLKRTPDSASSTRNSRRGAGVIAVAALAVATFAGSATAGAATVAKKNPKSSTTTAPTAANRQKALAAYAKCLTGKGIKLPANFGARRPDDNNTLSPSSRRANPNGTPSSGGIPNGPRSGGDAGGFGGGGGFRGGLRQAPAGVDPTKWAAAQKACASKLPKFGFRGGAAFNAYRACLTRNGVKFGTGANAARPNTSDPTVQAAMKTCAALRPTGPNGGPGGTGGPGSGGNTAPPSLSS